jgi:hypothetical protein
MNRASLPYETPVEDVLVKIRETFNNPNIGKVTQVPLKNGPRAGTLSDHTPSVCHRRQRQCS